VGVVLLLGVQSLADNSTQEDWSGSASWMLLHYLLNGIAYSYRASSQADGNVLVQFIGYVFGVGVCEETTKLLPVLYRMRTRTEICAADVRVIGFMSGIGFGVAEGVIYSVRDYNGSIMYFIRFFSVVAMHGIATAVAAGLLFSRNFQEDVEQELGYESTWKLFAKFALIISPVISLHALYDLFCDRGMFDGALSCELILMALLAYQIDHDRPVFANSSGR
jgi:RsiW-degrading membrane proteinase PrsW (M82 family)